MEAPTPIPAELASAAAADLELRELLLALAEGEVRRESTPMLARKCRALVGLAPSSTTKDEEGWTYVQGEDPQHPLLDYVRNSWRRFALAAAGQGDGEASLFLQHVLGITNPDADTFLTFDQVLSEPAFQRVPDGFDDEPLVLSPVVRWLGRAVRAQASRNRGPRWDVPPERHPDLLPRTFDGFADRIAARERERKAENRFREDMKLQRGASKSRAGMEARRRVEARRRAVARLQAEGTERDREMLTLAQELAAQGYGSKGHRLGRTGFVGPEVCRRLGHPRSAWQSLTRKIERQVGAEMQNLRAGMATKR